MKLFLKLVLLVSIPTMALILLLYKNLNDQLIIDVNKEAIALKQKDLEELFTQYKLTITNTKNTINLASISSIKEFNNEDLQYEKIIKFFKGTDNLVKMKYVSNNGIEIISVDRKRIMLTSKGDFIFNEDIFQIPSIENTIFISKIYKDKDSDILLMDMSKQVIDIKTGRTLGVTILSFSLYEFQKALFSKLIDFEGLAIFDNKNKNFIYKSEKIKDLEMNLQNIKNSVYSYNDEKEILKNDYANEGISIFALLNNKDLNNTTNEIVINNLLLLVSLLLAIFVIITIVIKKVLDPIDILIIKIKQKLHRLNKNASITAVNEIDALDKFFQIYDETLLKERQKLEELNTNLNEKIAIEVENSRKKDLTLNQQSKMVALGEMIGNIAHQWRQPLSAISTTASGIKIKNELGLLNEKEVIEYTELILKNTNYLSETINTFKNFLKYDKDEDIFSIHKAINDSLEIVKSTMIDNNIIIKDDYKNKEDIEIMMVLRELEEVIINIINNAQYALTSNNIKEPWIKIDIKKLENTFVVSIEDNAKGIKEDIIHRVFEPYFTTKHKSQGTGLGLHMSYKIVKESLNGDLYVKNTSNDAKFYIELPTEEID